MNDEKQNESVIAEETTSEVSESAVEAENEKALTTSPSANSVVVGPLETGENALVALAQEIVIPPPPAPTTVNAPWPLQQFFNGDIDLDVELSERFQNVPVLSVINFRSMGKKTGRGVATITAQDGSAHMIVDADKNSKIVQFSFTFGSMLTLRFSLDQLSAMDRSRWLELMRREHGGLAFLWGPNRWQNDYLICVSRKYFTNLYAFSPNNFEAAARLTPEVLKKLLEWLEGYWKEETKDDEPPQLLTW